MNTNTIRYAVQTQRGDSVSNQEYTTLAEALKAAAASPYTVLWEMDDDGSTCRDEQGRERIAYYSPKHPPSECRKFRAE